MTINDMASGSGAFERVFLTSKLCGQLEYGVSITDPCLGLADAGEWGERGVGSASTFKAGRGEVAACARVVYAAEGRRARQGVLLCALTVPAPKQIFSQNVNGARHPPLCVLTSSLVYQHKYLR